MVNTNMIRYIHIFSRQWVQCPQNVQNGKIYISVTFILRFFFICSHLFRFRKYFFHRFRKYLFVSFPTIFFFFSFPKIFFFIVSDNIFLRCRQYFLRWGQYFFRFRQYFFPFRQYFFASEILSILTTVLYHTNIYVIVSTHLPLSYFFYF